MDTVCLAIIYRYPIAIDLGGAIRAAGVKGRRLALGLFLHQAEHFGSRGLIEAGLLLQLKNANRLKEAQSAYRVGICSIFRCFKAHGDMALRGEIVDLIRLSFLN